MFREYPKGFVGVRFPICGLRSRVDGAAWEHAGRSLFKHRNGHPEDGVYASLMSAQPTLVLSAEKYQFWAIDYVENKVTIVPQQGKTITTPIEDDTFFLPDIHHSIFDWEKVWINTITRRGHWIVHSGFNPESEDQGPHRPTIYLDQNRWSFLATVAMSPDRVRNEKERAAAQELFRLANDDGAILPLSGGHLLETSALHTERRYEIGVTIAQLAVGWQMRHPMDVWEQEAIDALGRRRDASLVSVDRPVVTTEPRAWMQDTSAPGLGPAPEGTSDLFFAMLSAPGEMVQQLISPEPLQRANLQKWVTTHERITRQFRGVHLPKEQKRAMARRRFWNENLGIYRGALLRAFGTPDLPTFSDKDLKKILSEGPMTSLLSELFVTRFVDGTTRWEANDLVDMLYLSCGAAYCDYIVAETKTGTHLQQIQRSQEKTPSAFTNLHSLVEVLHADGLTTDTERRAAADERSENGA